MLVTLEDMLKSMTSLQKTRIETELSAQLYNTFKIPSIIQTKDILLYKLVILFLLHKLPAFRFVV